MSEVFSYTHPTGYLFSLNERVALSTSLPLLTTQTKRRRVRIWGKVFGLKANYILAQAFDDDLIAEPELFYSIDEGLTFTLIGTTSSLLSGVSHIGSTPMEQEEFKYHLLREIRGTFMGDPAYEYRVTSPHEVGGSSSSDRGSKGVSRSYKESLRVALFVEEHDYNCRVAPRGAFFQSERQEGLHPEIKLNSAFEGLPRTLEGALALKNYYHIRASNPYRRLLNMQLGKAPLEEIFENASIDAVFSNIAEDIPADLWRLQYDPLYNLVVGRNAQFPGSIFFHVPETAKYGNIYIGDGTINHNVAFMI
ncbi:unnamed protein product [Phytomonas sp. Hart1]|nr:unnamed protein product [Phytomonas sp. Hart1]|eukprot:CCW71444.1 unnamed protein product [Phytomonas sp. isolate Hart1]